MKHLLAIAAIIALSACQKEELPKEPPKPVIAQYRAPTVAECKKSVDIASQSAMKISFENGHKMDYIKRIWELTDDPIERMYAQKVVDLIFAAHIIENAKEPNVKIIKLHIGSFNDYCDMFELK